MQEKIILTERKSRRISAGKSLLNVKDLQVALAGGIAAKPVIIYEIATEKIKVKENRNNHIYGIKYRKIRSECD